MDDQEHDRATEDARASSDAAVESLQATTQIVATATYSAEDNKLRLYPATRLDRETYDRVKAAGFKWAPKQNLFVAGRWTPEREDLALELAGSIDDEETPLAERAAERAERFKLYSEKRGTDAERARAHVERIAGGIPMGQPILVVHHSERRARRDAERIRAGTAAAVRLHDTAAYWEHRAERVVRHAGYKADPRLRARRIATLEAEQRGHQRDIERATGALDLWTKVAATEYPERQREQAIKLANYSSHLRTPFDVWGKLNDGKITTAEACATCIACCEAQIASAKRWLDHVSHRLAYERVLLGRAPDEATPKVRRKSARASLPLLNYPAESVEGINKWRRGDTICYPQVQMTAADYARIHDDYRGTGVSVDGTHRFRIAMNGKSAPVSVFITDSKVHPRPGAKLAAVAVEPEPEAEEDEDELKPEEVSPTAPTEPPPAPVMVAAPVDAFEAMRNALKKGVQAVTVPELFVTPTELAQRVADEANIQDGSTVLEPSAGLGALAIAACAQGASVTCIDNAAAMVEALRRAGFVTHEGDFLKQTPEALGYFDRVLMNPPFSAEVEHVTHAWSFLRPGGRLVAIMSAGVRFHRTKKARSFRIFVEEHGTMEALPVGSFATSGTGANTVIVVVDKP